MQLKQQLLLVFLPLDLITSKKMLKVNFGIIMIKWLYLIFCYVGLHRYEKIDINFSFGPGGSTETVKCKDCGIKKLRKKR